MKKPNQIESKSDDKLEKRSKAISKYLEKIVKENPGEGEDEEKEIADFFSDLPLLEKVNTLYEKLMAYTIDKQQTRKLKKKLDVQDEEVDESIDEYLISEIKVLSSDKKVIEKFAKTYAKARLESREFESSDLNKLFQSMKDEINEKEKIYKNLERKIHLQKIKKPSELSAKKTQMARMANNLKKLHQRTNSLINLDNTSQVKQNTDAVANIAFEQIKEYKKQLAQGFVWLPSRKQIHQDTINAILNHRWPVLVGEAGSGKSEQADAAALELTGNMPTHIACEANTGYSQLISDISIDPTTGGSYEKYGPMMQAFTGYEDSQHDTPVCDTGRIVRMDESGRMGPKAYAIIKDARQKKAGDDFYGRPVLAGAGSIWTTNPVGSRYPDRHSPDPALRRELAEITVDYPPMDSKDPELYEFALTALLDENNHINSYISELAPGYQKKDLPDSEKKVLADGSIVIARDELIEDLADRRHGALWRFCGAIKAVQDGFVYGNSQTEQYPEKLLRFKENTDNNPEITTDGSGEVLTLHNSTVTLGELASWMSGFNERRQKLDESYHVNELGDWLEVKIKTYIKQADKEDKDKLKAIFQHYGFLIDKNQMTTEKVSPLTPQEIGYLSPRVPRPLYIEKPKIVVEDDKKEQIENQPMIEYETLQVLLESGQKANIKICETYLDDKKSIVVQPKDKFIWDKKLYVYSGIIEDNKHKLHQELVAQPADGEAIFSVITREKIMYGMMDNLNNKIKENLSEIENDLVQYCQEQI